MYQNFLDSKEVYQILNGDMQVSLILKWQTIKHILNVTVLDGTCLDLKSLKKKNSIFNPFV